MKGCATFLLVIFTFCCTKTDYYSKVKRDCNFQSAKNYYEELKHKNRADLFKLIEAMVDCKSEEMERFLTEEYTQSPESTKGHIYKLLIQSRSKAFLETGFNILINKIQTNMDYKSELDYINNTDPYFLERKYKELSTKLEDAKRKKNVIAIEVYSDTLKSLSKVLNKNNYDDKNSLDAIRSIKSERMREELYSDFIESATNQRMTHLYSIFKELKKQNLIQNNEKTRKLEEILIHISTVEDKFYETASRQDALMIEIEKEKKRGDMQRVKELEEELKYVKSEMVFRKRALDRASKKLEVVRELFEEVKIK
ncbi:MAG: hypothetical protein N2746_09705 [Deltaproteobacteria bacterium]|nr:hypothetical protein [Deltaproteobacteria bacterium]